MTHVDGNAIAGDLGAIFAGDLSAAVATCDGLRRDRTGGDGDGLRGMGEVLRCPECDAVLMRLIRMRGETHLDMRGIRLLRWQSAG